MANNAKPYGSLRYLSQLGAIAWAVDLAIYELACQRYACVPCSAPGGVLLYSSDDIVTSLRWYKYPGLPL